MLPIIGRFVRSEEDDSSDSWEVHMAKRYYAKLFKEYAIADLSRYKVCVLLSCKTHVHQAFLPS